MRVSTHDPESTQLAKGFMVRDYRAAVKTRNRERIANAIEDRFTERYIVPATGPGKHGFTVMAIACLMVEALESLKRGWKKSVRQSETLFVAFLDREDEFKDFRGFGHDFYVNVRCGILHQAETTRGLRVVRYGPLFDGHRTINAAKFIAALQRVLKSHCAGLKSTGWGSSEWNKVLRKMNNICDNCQS